MAGQPINITRGSTTVSGTDPVSQPSKEAIDLQGISGQRFDFALRTYFISGASAEATVVVKTAMFNDDNPSNWKTLATFTGIDTSNSTVQESKSMNVLRYLRWEVTLTGTDPSYTFELVAMAW